MCKIHKTTILNFGKIAIPDQKFGNTKLNVYPFTHTGRKVSLPSPYSMWEDTLNEMLKHIPLQEGADEHYITINSDFFTEDGFQRGEGVHMDGNFCVDPTFVYDNGDFKAGWGGSRIKKGHFVALPDNAHVTMNWVIPYKDVIIPVGTYVSDQLGGILIASNNIGTRAWGGIFYGEVSDGGSYKEMESQLTQENEQFIPANELVFMTSNTPHETIMVPRGERRTFLRLTLNHQYKNNQIKKLKTLGKKNV